MPNGAVITEAVFWVVNKPVGYLCTNDDPAGRPRAVDLLPHVEQRVYAVGRLDEASEGLLLMTNDGELAFHLMHPRFGVPKTYLVKASRHLSDEELDALRRGLELRDGPTRPAEVTRLRESGGKTVFEITITEGRNRQVRRMVEAFEAEVLKLVRVAIGPLRIGEMQIGSVREMTAKEVRQLR